MRTLLLFALTVGLVASAGCFGKDDENGDGATPTPTTGATPTTGTPPTGTTPATPTDPTPATPTAPAPRELCPLSFDFQGNVQPGPPPTEVTMADCGTVPAGYTTISIMGNFTSAEPAIVTGGVSVSILDAAGTAVLTCNGPSAGPAAPATCAGEAPATAGGAYTVQWNGAGNIDFAGSVMVS